MNDNFIKEMFELSNKLDRYHHMLRLKCEVCGPILRGADPKNYPKCKRHQKDGY